MTNANQSCGLSGDNKHALQDAEIRERLKHIKKKILVMSGLKCPHCKQSIDLFKTNGGQLMAEKEGLSLW